MKIMLNSYTVELSDLMSAKWDEIDSGNATTYQVDDYSHAIIAIPVGDDVWWDGIEARDVPALDAEGNTCKISISLDVCDDESSHIYINDTDEVGHAESEEGEDYYAYDLAKLCGHTIGGKMTLDYDDAADDFIRDNPNARYVMNNMRGFANEWTLYVCADETAAEGVKSRFEDCTEYDAESVRPWLISAMQSKEDYEADHAAVKCCGAMWAEDIDD